jgi:phosphohistidine phosphatase
MRDTGEMRFLLIVRHCEARPASGSERDWDRPLTDRGREQAAQIREWMTEEALTRGYVPARVLVSSARRTRETFTQTFEAAGVVEESVVSNLIYNGGRDVSGEDILADLGALDDVRSNLAVVAHNPSVSELVYGLVGGWPEGLSEGLPVGAVIVLELDDNRPVGLSHYRWIENFLPD